MRPYRSGRVDTNALAGFFHVVERVQGHGVRIPDLQITSLPTVDSDDDVDASGTGRLYFAWISGGSAASIVQFTDNNIVIACAKVSASGFTEVYFYDGTDGVGIPYSTDLEVNAVLASDGSTPAATTARPDVIVVWGDDAINTEDSATANTNYA